MKSLRHKIALFLGLSALFALLAGVAVSVLHYESRVRRYSRAELRTMSKNFSSRLDLASAHLADLLKSLCDPKSCPRW